MERPNKEIARLSLKYRETMLRNAVPNPVKNYENIDAFKATENIFIRTSITLPLRRKAHLF